MYIHEVEINAIRSIAHFKMSFPTPAGWHVIIGDNGAGKSTIVRSIALALIGPTDTLALRLPLIDWVQENKGAGEIILKLQQDPVWDSYWDEDKPIYTPFFAGLKIAKEENSNSRSAKIESTISGATVDPFRYIWGGAVGWFSASFGPFRRFTGGDKDWSTIYKSNPKAASHLSVFGEDVALTEILEWLKSLRFKDLEGDLISRQVLNAIQTFINEGGLLPHGTKLSEITSSGVLFVDGNGAKIEIYQLSDGFRSLLSLIFEMIRQLVRVFGDHQVFKNILDGEMIIDVPGVVLIDEIDAHLHPTWQTQIGGWFTKYFPKIQFIVTSHSPLICRASERGTIWRLRSPGSQFESGEVIGIERDRLIFGNILDAYGTEIFGKSPVRSEKSEEKLDKLGELNMLAAFGKISPEQEKERIQLQKILSTDDPTGFPGTQQ